MSQCDDAESEGSVTTGRRLTQRNSTPVFAKCRCRFDVSLFPLAHDSLAKMTWRELQCNDKQGQTRVGSFENTTQADEVLCRKWCRSFRNCTTRHLRFWKLYKSDIEARLWKSQCSISTKSQLMALVFCFTSSKRDLSPSSINLHRWRKQNYHHKLLHPSLPWPHVQILSAGSQRSQSWAERGPPALRAPYLRIGLAVDSTGWFEATRKSAVI